MTIWDCIDRNPIAMIVFTYLLVCGTEAAIRAWRKK